VGSLGPMLPVIYADRAPGQNCKACSLSASIWSKLLFFGWAYTTQSFPQQNHYRGRHHRPQCCKDNHLAHSTTGFEIRL